MTADEKKHEKRCETCSKIGMPLCPISKYLDRYSTTKDIIPILTMIVGCASHSSNQIASPAFTPSEFAHLACSLNDCKCGNCKDISVKLCKIQDVTADDDPLTAAYLKGKEDGRKEAGQRIADVIKELERRKYLSIDVTIDEAISLLQVKK